MPLIFAFFSTILRFFNLNSTSCLIPNVVGSSTFSLISISTQTISSTSFLNLNTIQTIPFISFLTSMQPNLRLIKTFAMNLLLDLIYLELEVFIIGIPS
jgi:hypothetical protein